MAEEKELQPAWYKRPDAFEILHYVSQYDEKGLEPEKLQRLRDKGSIESNRKKLEKLAEENALDEEDGSYTVNYSKFSQVAKEQWINPLSDRQERFITQFARKYVNDRKRGTVRNMLTRSLAHGILEEKSKVDEEILQITEMIATEEDYDTPGIYVELAQKEM